MRIPLLVLAFLLDTSHLMAQAPARWWSFQSLKSPPVPSSQSPHPIDVFIRAKLAERKLSPSPEADRRTLIRRLTFDLTGLPPSPEEIETFLNDKDPKAYAKLVDRLLASPHYGERQARHWMDLVHFAETHGHDQDRVRPDAWRYRDYLIQSFNDDKPYPRFAREQLAADVLFPDEPGLTAALGFLAAGPWDESSLRDIREDSIDRQIGHYLDRDDMISTTMNTFVSLTAGCARCHDHKFDPITAEEIYKLQAVFAGVGRGNVAYDSDPKIAARRAELTNRMHVLEKNDETWKKLISKPAIQSAIRKWEEESSSKPQSWHDVTVISSAAEHGSTLTVLPDGSIRSSHTKRPERERYTVKFQTQRKPITALRLELLTDDTFPHLGPGLQDNGNLHLSEIAITIDDKPVAIKAPVSDFDQQGWTIQHAVDDNPATAWGIYPKVGEPHEAIFPFEKPIEDGTLTVRLDQLHGGGHLIGRFRISVTTDKQPKLGQRIPPGIARLIRISLEKRTSEQQKTINLFALTEITRTELNSLPPRMLVYAASSRFETDGSHKPLAQPRTVHLLRRGDIHKPVDEMEPGTIDCLPELRGHFQLPEGHSEGERRAALANWIADDRNGLFWRSIVNRVWQSHFGCGIVDTPNDFGKMGGRPSHPELLDWLAVWFRDDAKGSLKKLHKLIVTSATYKQRSITPINVANDPLTIDGENRLLWRMPRTKLDAEQVRDAILLTSGTLDRRQGGPSDQQFSMKPGIHVTPIVDYSGYDWARPEGHRRSVYRFVFRTLPDPLVDCLDGADASQLTPKRNASITAPQSLAILNNDFILACSHAMAKDLKKCQNPIDEACLRLWGRKPTLEEHKEFASYAIRHGLANLCRILMNTNEFLFVD